MEDNLGSPSNSNSDVINKQSLHDEFTPDE